MISSKLVALSFAALSGIAILAILRKISSSLQNKSELHFVEVDSDAEIKEGEDFISQLPDDILLMILVLLPTRDSVRTSILSRRWRKLYAFVPHMEFCCLNMFRSEHLDHLSYFRFRRLRKRFINGVDTFLSLHAVRIYSCSLSCCFITSFPDKLEEWFRSLGRLDISYLNLNFTCPGEIPVFDCGPISLAPSLECLNLVGCCLRQTSDTRPNLLTNLNLKNVTLSPGAVTCIFSSCFCLEYLMLENYTTLDSTLLRICFRNLQLKCLFIKFCSNIEKIEIYADNLVLFEYHGRYYEMFEPVMFNGFRNVKYLSLGFSMFKPDQLSVALVLEMCPVLYDLVLQIEKSSAAFQGQEVSTRSFEFHQHLTQVGFSGFSGTKSEMDAAVYILSSAMVLKQMTLSYCFSYYLGRSEWADNGKAPLSKINCETIEGMLRGHAISKNAEVIVRPIYLSGVIKSHRRTRLGQNNCV